jgi:hypothetical protein
MMKAAPASSFVLAQPEFLFEFLIIALDDPTLFGQRDQILQIAVAGRVDSQYLLGSASPLGHSMINHSSACGSVCQ